MNHFSFKRLLLVVMTAIFISGALPSLASSQPSNIVSTQQKLAALEASSGGRLGIFALNTANNMVISYRAVERFPMGCTSKVIGVGAMLKNSMTDPHLLRERVLYKKEDLVSWSPITEQHLTEGMTVASLGAAAIMYSDNTAMNLLIKKMGGLNTVNAFARSIVNFSTRMDRGYPGEASAIPGDFRDTSTPVAMAKTMQELTLGNVLAPTQRAQLLIWLKANTTGDHRIRAGVPKGWRVGDKTGSGDFGTTNDLAIIWPPGGSPIVMAVYFTQMNKEASKREDIVAAATHITLSAFNS